MDDPHMSNTYRAVSDWLNSLAAENSLSCRDHEQTGCGSGQAQATPYLQSFVQPGTGKYEDANSYPDRFLKDNPLSSPAQSHGLSRRRSLNECCHRQLASDSRTSDLSSKGTSCRSLSLSAAYADKKFLRRLRHKMRDDRYVPGGTKRQKRASASSASRSRKKRHNKSRRHVLASRHEVMQNFTSKAIGASRVSMRPQLKPGMFLNGRSSAFTPNKLADLSFFHPATLEKLRQRETAVSNAATTQNIGFSRRDGELYRPKSPETEGSDAQPTDSPHKAAMAHIVRRMSGLRKAATERSRHSPRRAIQSTRTDSQKVPSSRRMREMDQAAMLTPERQHSQTPDHIREALIATGVFYVGPYNVTPGSGENNVASCQRGGIHGHNLEQLGSSPLPSRSQTRDLPPYRDQAVMVGASLGPSRLTSSAASVCSSNDTPDAEARVPNRGQEEGGREPARETASLTKDEIGANTERSTAETINHQELPVSPHVQRASYHSGPLPLPAPLRLRTSPGMSDSRLLGDANWQTVGNVEYGRSSHPFCAVLQAGQDASPFPMAWVTSRARSIPFKIKASTDTSPYCMPRYLETTTPWQRLNEAGARAGRIGENIGEIGNRSGSEGVTFEWAEERLLHREPESGPNDQCHIQASESQYQALLSLFDAGLEYGTIPAESAGVVTEMAHTWPVEGAGDPRTDLEEYGLRNFWRPNSCL